MLFKKTAVYTTMLDVIKELLTYLFYEVKKLKICFIDSLHRFGH